MKQCLFIVVYCLFMDSNDKCIIKVFTIFGAISSVLELRDSRTFNCTRFWFVTIRDIISDLRVRTIQKHSKWFIEPNLSSRINPWFHQHDISFETEQYRYIIILHMSTIWEFNNWSIERYFNENWFYFMVLHQNFERFSGLGRFSGLILVDTKFDWIEFDRIAFNFRI